MTQSKAVLVFKLKTVLDTQYNAVLPLTCGEPLWNRVRRELSNPDRPKESMPSLLLQ